MNKNSVGILFTGLVFSLSLTACDSTRIKKDDVSRQIDRELQQAAQGSAKPASAEAVNQALLPPLTVEMPQGTPQQVEPRFDLSVNNAPAPQVFMALVAGTRYSMLVSPEIQETISVNLKDVTLNEALEAIRELYGYEYKIQGKRVYIEPITIQTRIFQVNYLAGHRSGTADTRVTSGSIQSTGNPNGTAVGAATSASVGGNSGTTQPAGTVSSQVTTTSNNDLWSEIGPAINSIIGSGDGRNVIVNPQAGVILVRALPSELRSVEQYLKAMSIMVERQVMLEAKIIEVALNDQYSTGINWATFKTGANSRFAGGLLTPGTTLRPDGSIATFTGRAPDGNVLSNSALIADPTASSPTSPDPLNPTLAGTFGSATGLLDAGSNVAGSIFGLAFQTGSFAALLNFLESQGTVHVLSSPRIATLNNQKAVIKVGTDEFFVTNISTTTTSTGTTNTVSPTITVQPFFSGIALDVTPQISDDGQVTLHIHPSVSSVIDKSKTLNLGTLGTITLPLASSDINESDTIVRVRDGTVAAIGGLMKQQQTNDRSGLPGISAVPVVGNLFGSRSQQLTKSELVILLKTTVIKSDANWQDQAQEVNERVQLIRRPQAEAAPRQ
jgi:MSHA biogenesis protein MshL